MGEVLQQHPQLAPELFPDEGELASNSAEQVPEFDEREQVLERFADMPMVHIVKGVPQKVSGSYEAVILCGFLQNKKLPPEYLEVKFQAAADLYVELENTTEQAIEKSEDTTEQQNQIQEDTLEPEQVKANTVNDTKTESAQNNSDAADSEHGSKDSLDAPLINDRGASDALEVIDAVESDSLQADAPTVEQVDKVSDKQYSSAAMRDPDPDPNPVTAPDTPHAAEELPGLIDDEIQVSMVTDVVNEADATKEVAAIDVEAEADALDHELISPTTSVLAEQPEQITNMPMSSEIIVPVEAMHDSAIEPEIHDEQADSSLEAVHFKKASIPGQFTEKDDSVKTDAAELDEFMELVLNYEYSLNIEPDSSDDKVLARAVNTEVRAMDTASTPVGDQEQLLNISAENVLIKEYDMHDTTEILDDPQPSMSDILIELVGEIPEQEMCDGIQPIEVSRKVALVVALIEQLERSQTPEDCRGSLRQLYSELSNLLTMLGYTNSNKIAQQLVNNYSTAVLKQYMQMLIQMLSLGGQSHGLVVVAGKSQNQFSHRNFGMVAVNQVIAIAGSLPRWQQYAA